MSIVLLPFVSAPAAALRDDRVHSLLRPLNLLFDLFRGRGLLRGTLNDEVEIKQVQTLEFKSNFQLICLYH